jgi:hypothetical protein
MGRKRKTLKIAKENKKLKHRGRKEKDERKEKIQI